MTRKLKIWLLGIFLFLLFAIGAWFLAPALGLRGQDVWVLRGGLWLLDAIVVGVLVWFLLRRSPKSPKRAPEEEREIDAAVAAARSRLSSSQLAGASGLDHLPVVLVLGPEASSKTTLVVRSGLDLELLSGEVFRGDAVAPTRSINIWYSKDAVLLEAGSRVVAEAGRWKRLVHHLHPRRLRAALSGSAQAPRLAVVCFSCEEFLRPDAAESVTARAQSIRSRLSELALELGIRLPVYVVFTKTDRIPHFAEYVRNFTRDESREVFGITLPFDTQGADSYAEREFKRVDRVFQRFFHSLASKRLKFLPRENLPESAASAYEFPREFRKIIPHATQFLLDLCRPSQLEVSPLLRGFYFVGVRPVVVTEAAFEMAPQTSATNEPMSVPIGATSVFNPGKARGAVAAKLAEAAPTARKVPQWLFLDRLFPEVILNDPAAMKLTQGGRRVDLLRRLLLAGVMAGAVFVALGFTISYLGNRQLQQSVLEARRDLPAQGKDEQGLPTLDALRRVDALRDELATLTQYERHGPPWRLRWGLYTGSALYPAAWRDYFRAFEQLQFGPARDSLVTALRTLPDAPTQSSDYGRTYATLKAYQITTTHPEKSTVDFLAPVLQDRWLGATKIDPTRAELARRQFAFYAEELPVHNPFTAEDDPRTVAHARGFLNQFTGIEPIYRSLLAAVSAKVPSIDFGRKYPNAAGIVRDPFVVSGPYTKQGWAEVHAALKDVDRYFKGETWVVGDEAPVRADRDKVVGELRTLYVKDYVSQWRQFLNAAAVERIGGVQDGARKLAPIVSNQSPLLALFSLVSRNTTVDTQLVAPQFQPVQVVTPPGDTAKFIGPANEAYVNALSGLQASLDQIGKAPPDGADAMVSQAQNDASQALAAAKQVANKFRIDEVGKVHLIVQRLMEAPIEDVQFALQTVGPAQLNGKGRVFCAPFQQLMAKYPFNPTGDVPATLDEVAALLQPGTGALWKFVESQLANYVVQQGPQFAEKPGTPVRISPSFLAFLNRAADFATSIYHGENAPPGLAFTMRPRLSETLPALTVTIDGQPATFTRTSTAVKRINWVAKTAQEAMLSGQIEGRPLQLSYHGTWAIFKLFNQADWFPGEGFYSVEWPLRNPSGGPPLKAKFDVNLVDAKPILDRNFFAGVSCSGRITR
ncbi:MAG TPA: ImcF-related family protein [Gemmatimonadales bacterium]|jgi:type VI secretion system protein ImpL